MANDGKQNNARYELDFGIIPKIFYKDPGDFVTRCLRWKDGYVCAMFNRYYELVNKVFFPNHPKRFDPSQFALTESKIEGGRVIYITLPTEHEGSLVYCSAYAAAYRKGFFGIKDAKLFLIERSVLGTDCIGTMDPEGKHVNFGPVTGSIQGDIARIAEIVRSQKTKK